MRENLGALEAAAAEEQEDAEDPGSLLSDLAHDQPRLRNRASASLREGEGSKYRDTSCRRGGSCDVGRQLPCEEGASRGWHSERDHSPSRRMRRSSCGSHSWPFVGQPAAGGVSGSALVLVDDACEDIATDDLAVSGG